MLAVLCFGLIGICLSSCRKTEFRKVDNPAYIRVFNNLTYTVALPNKEEQQPFFCLFIDPEFDASGKPIGGLVVSDFLDKRAPYASPNPAHAGLSTSKFNPEYPGKELVPTAPILNGFDLTNWAQIKSGTRRFVFMSRPISDVGFFQLPDELQRRVFLDTTINLSEKEVYTIHLLQRDFNTKKNGLYVRQETFHKQAFSDTLTYVNFYNLSAKGFLQASAVRKLPVPTMSRTFRFGTRDTLNAYFTHIQPATSATGVVTHTPIPEFSYQFAGTVYRTTDHPKVTPYYGFPIFLKADKKVYTDTWQFLQFCAPPLSPRDQSAYGAPPSTEIFSTVEQLQGTYGILQFHHARYTPAIASSPFYPGLTVDVHSGVNNPRTFGVVNSIEIVNGNAFLMTVQRKYPQPIY